MLLWKNKLVQYFNHQTSGSHIVHLMLLENAYTSCQFLCLLCTPAIYFLYFPLCAVNRPSYTSFQCIHMLSNSLYECIVQMYNNKEKHSSLFYICKVHKNWVFRKNVNNDRQDLNDWCKHALWTYYKWQAWFIPLIIVIVYVTKQSSWTCKFIINILMVFNQWSDGPRGLLKGLHA